MLRVSQLTAIAPRASILDEDIWEKAKHAVDKSKYKGGSYWAVVQSVYDKMGGKRKKEKHSYIDHKIPVRSMVSTAQGESAADRLRDIREEMFELLQEALGIIQASGVPMAYERARSYWAAHIEGALYREGPSGFLGGSFINMDDSIDELEEGGGAEEDEGGSEETESPMGDVL